MSAAHDPARPDPGAAAMAATPAAPPSQSAARTRTDTLTPWPAQAMLGLLDRDPHDLDAGDPLPLGWHWLYFKEAVRASGLAPDGHVLRGGFMPETGLPRRMWAGGMLRALRPVVLGRAAALESRVARVTEKEGRSGRLVFVTVAQTVLQGGEPCVAEEQVIVYREAETTAGARAGTASAARSPDPSPAAPPLPGPPDRHPLWSETFRPTPVTLFQFSALTYNGHRIHYDHPYVTGREGYAGLLVHGPLTALLLLDAARRHEGGPVARFRYRALAPLFVGEPITLVGRAPANQARAAPADAAQPGPESIVEALAPDGSVAMRGWHG